MSTSLPSPEWQLMPRPRPSLPLLGLLVVAALMLMVSVASLTEQFAGASEPVAARPRAEIVDACEGGSLVVHVLLFDDGGGATSFKVVSRLGDGPTLGRAHHVAGSDLAILEFVVPSGDDATIRVTSADDPKLDRRRQAASDCAPV